MLIHFKYSIKCKKNINPIIDNIYNNNLIYPMNIICIKTKLNDLIQDYENTKNPNKLIEIGNIYRKGEFGITKPNTKAAKYYYEIATHSTNPTISTIATTKYIEASNDIIEDIDNYGIDIDLIPISNSILDIPDPIIQNEIRNVNPFINNNVNVEFLNDTQNVHDHFMTNTINANIKYLKDNHKYTNLLFDYDFLKKYKNYNNKTENVVNSLSDIKHSKFNISEIEAFTLINEYILSKTNKDDLYKNLIDQDRKSVV